MTFKVEKKTAKVVAEGIKRALLKAKARVKSMTYDNGLQFAAHQLVSSALGAKSYFAEPYKSWQRGTNENTNGLIRQYIPKKTSFAHVSQDDLKQIIHRLNHRPRKCLDYDTPFEAFERCVRRSKCRTL